MITVLEIIDTTVKVGLGALISGISTYAVTKKKSHEETKRERLKRHHELLEATAEQIEIFSHIVLRYWALTAEWVRSQEQKSNFPEHRKEELIKTKADLFNAYSELTSAESKLLLLGHLSAQKRLRDYGNTTKEMRRHAHDNNPSLTSSEMEEYRNKILNARAELFKELSSVYRHET